MKYKNTYITLETTLFNDLERKVNKFNLHHPEDGKNKIMMDKAVFFIDFIRYQKSIRKDDITPNGYIRIPSKILNIYLQKELKKYKDFLVQFGYIKTIRYSKEKSESYGYLVYFLKSKNRKQIVKQEYSAYEFLSLTYEKYLSESLNQHAKIEKKKIAAERTTKHLTKWLNGNDIQIDWKSAFKFVVEDKTLSDDKKRQYSYSINRIRFKQWCYIRSVNDNRLHSNLTNLPSELRKFLSYKDQKLVSLDVKTSHPYLLVGIFNLIIENKDDKLSYLIQGIRSKVVRDKFTTVMNSVSLSTSTITDFTYYKNMVCNNDLYDYIGTMLSPDFIKSIETKKGYVDRTYNPSKGRKEKKSFKTLRGYCKVLILEYMYCSLESNEKRLKELRKIYPKAVNDFIDDFKYCKELKVPKSRNGRKRTKRQKEKITKSKKLFAKFLQQLEAFIVLDVLTKELSRLKPEMFMATIHDSIIVPKVYETYVKSFLQKRLYETLGVEAEIKSEEW